MSMMRIEKRCGKVRSACVVGAFGLLFAASLAFAAVATASSDPPPAASPQAATPQAATVSKVPSYRMPRVLPSQFTSFASDSVRSWSRSARAKVRDRAAFYAAIHELFRMNARFGDRVAKIYPKNQLEWILTTDRAADTLSVALGPLMKAYAKAFPEEVLTAGRIAYEERIARIVGPPSKMLGFHVVMLGDHALAEADSVLATKGMTDVAGVQDGVLRSLQDWVQLYDQAHSDAVKRHEAQMTAEDWILVRLEDNCGNKGADVWKITEMWVAMVGTDSTKTPPEEQFAHEYKINSKKCPGDERDIFIDMTFFQEASKEIYRRSVEKDRQIQEEMKKKPE